MRLFTPSSHPLARLGRHPRSGMQTCTMRFEALPIARPTTHGRPVQSPTKYRTKCGQICRLRVTAQSQTAHTYAAMSASRSGTAAATRSGGAAAVMAAATPVIVAVTAMSLDGVSPAHRERKHVSQLTLTCATLVATRARTRTRGHRRAHGTETKARGGATSEREPRGGLPACW